MSRSKEGGTALSGLGENALVFRIREAAGWFDPEVIRGIGDDAAVVAAGGKVLLTTDLLVEDVHFRLAATPARRLGRKALSVNLSDIAAMGGVPRFALLGLAAPPSFPAAVLEEILAGFLERAKESGVSLVGGDVVRGERLVLAVTVTGTASPPAPVYRSGAGEGDLIFVSGNMGDSALGLRRLAELPPPVTEKTIAADPLAGPLLCHLDPPARLSLGKRLAGIATAMMDLSDGILTDLPRLLTESGGRGAELWVNHLPLSAEFRNHFGLAGEELSAEALGLALAGGEDYELIFTIREKDRDRVAAAAEEEGISLSCIGRLRPEPGLSLRGTGGREVPLPRPVFNHFPEE